MHRPIQTPAAACAVEVEEVVKLKRQLKRFQSEICEGGILLLIRLVVPVPHVGVTVIHEKISGSYIPENWPNSFVQSAEHQNRNLELVGLPSV